MKSARVPRTTPENAREANTQNTKGGRLTEPVLLENLLLERVLRADGDEGLVRPQGLEAERLAMLLAPLHLEIEHVEQRDGVLERLLDRHVAVRDGQ